MRGRSRQRLTGPLSGGGQFRCYGTVRPALRGSAKAVTLVPREEIASRDEDYSPCAQQPASQRRADAAGSG